MLVKIACPTCGTEGTTSFVESRYAGPYKCWKCKALFNIVIEDKVVKSCEPLSEEEFRKQQEIEALRAKFKK
ncbi:MAG: hypothetical protein ABID87_03835 [Chloroflexota bacterium]